MKRIIFLLISIMSLDADTIMSVKSIKPNGGVVQYQPFIFQQQIGYEMWVYLHGNLKSGEMMKYDRKTSKVSPFGGILTKPEKRLYEFTSTELILKGSNVHILANNDQRYQLSKTAESNCFVADEDGFRKDKLLLCLYSVEDKK